MKEKQKTKEELYKILVKAEKQQQEGNFSEALEILREADEFYDSDEKFSSWNPPQNSTEWKDMYWTKRANIFFELLQEYGKARECYQKMNQSCNFRILEAIGDCWRMQKNYEKAIGFYESASKRSQNDESSSPEDDARIYNSLGMSFLESQQFAAAEETLKKAAENDEESALYLWNLGRVFEQQGKNEEAAIKYSEAYKLIQEGNDSQRIVKAHEPYLKSIFNKIIALANLTKKLKENVKVALQKNPKDEILIQAEKRFDGLQVKKINVTTEALNIEKIKEETTAKMFQEARPRDEILQEFTASLKRKFKDLLEEFLGFDCYFGEMEKQTQSKDDTQQRKRIR